MDISEANSFTTENTVSTNGSTVQRVVKYIENEIQSGRLQAGSRLPTEAELCSLLNVSRTSVREAIKIMESITIVNVRRGDGMYIAYPENITVYNSLVFKMLLNKTTWNELFEFREQMEFVVIRCAINHATDEDINDLRLLNEKIQECAKNNPSDYQKLFDFDIKFHIRLVKAAHNRMLEDIYNYCLNLFSPLILGNYKAGQGIGPTVDSHTAILDALIKKDIFLAGYAAHISVALWAKWVKKQDSPFSVYKE